MTWQLRRAGISDLDDIIAIEQGVFANDAWSRESMADELNNPHGYYLVAFAPEHPDVIDAYAGLLAVKGAKQADIQTVAVTERARRKGLGRTLMLTLINEARKRGARDVFLEVRADNPDAKRLYATLGFEQIAIRPEYYRPDRVDAIVMRLRIAEPRFSLAVGGEVVSPVGEDSDPGSQEGPS